MFDQFIAVFGLTPGVIIVAVSLHVHLGAVWVRIRKVERRTRKLARAMGHAEPDDPITDPSLRMG